MASTTPASDLYEPKSADEIQAAASSQVGAEITGELQPYQSAVATTQGRQDRAIGELGKMFDGLMPYVQGSAQRVTESFDRGTTAVKDIYNTAAQRLNDLKQSRAAEAQSLAQEMGGPVAISEFTAGTALQEREFPHAAAGAQLHALGNAQAGSQLAEAFAGKVFPAIRVEEEVRTRAKFDEQVRELNEKIAAIKATKVGRVNARLNDLQVQERSYELQKAQQQLAELNAKRDWQATKSQLAQSKEQAKRENARIALEKAGLLGYYDKKWRDKKGKLHTSRIPTLGGRQLNEQLTTSVADRTGYNPDTGTPTPTTVGQQIELKKMKEDWKVGQRTINLEVKSRAQELTDAVMAPGVETIKSTKYSPVDRDTFIADDGDPASLIRGPGPDGKLGGKHGVDDVYYTAKDVTETVEGVPLNQIGDVYKALVGHGIPKNIALQTVRARFADTKWRPGMRPDNATSDSAGDRRADHAPGSWPPKVVAKMGDREVIQEVRRHAPKFSGTATMARKILTGGKK